MVEETITTAGSRKYSTNRATSEPLWVAEIALMAPGVNADWQITVSGWLGSTSSRAVPVAPSLTALPLDKVLCLYGEEEADSACPLLAGTAATVIRTAGGHHFDGNYDALAQHLLDGPALAD